MILDKYVIYSNLTNLDILRIKITKKINRNYFKDFENDVLQSN